MNTPIVDFVKNYEKQNIARLHMPGHKGKTFLGCEAMDITEICGADSLYEADGIIAESEANATKLFGSGKTLYSTEGASQCIRAMLYLALLHERYCEHPRVSKDDIERPLILAARNVHKSFVQAAAVLDLDVEWIYPKKPYNSICSCEISAVQLEEKLKSLSKPPIAVYVTSPDYLGGQLDIKALSEVCHHHKTLLAVDNAHGAYLKFLTPSLHPMDLGADICCDSAHKTFPVLTGGAYLHISKNAPKDLEKNARQAMALFGSTSPSYLTLMSLDLCNQYLSEEYSKRLENTIDKLHALRQHCRECGWDVEASDPLKLTLAAEGAWSGLKLAEELRKNNIECEYADPEYVVCMFTPENQDEDYRALEETINKLLCNSRQTRKDRIPMFNIPKCQRAMSIREAVFAPHEEISVIKSAGRICASPTVSCPPAIPIVVSGEHINKEAVELFQYYGIETVDVLTEFEK